jgi:two-component system response regulator RegA
MDLEKHILIIDDDATLLQVLERAFKRRGFVVSTAQTGEQALQICQASQPTHISLDLKLSQETGLHLIPQLKILAPLAPIVMLTAYASIATAVDAIKLGAHQYLCKPVDADQLLAGFSGDINTDSQAEQSEAQEKPTSMKRLEWERIQQSLQNNQGNVSATARELGMHRRTLQRKLLKHPVKH